MKVIEVKNEGGSVILNIAERSIPEPKENEVLVRWHATSLNYHDYLIAKGLIIVKDGRIPMSDGAGEIVALGSRVKNWNTGDRVMSLFFPVVASLILFKIDLSIEFAIYEFGLTTDPESS